MRPTSAESVGTAALKPGRPSPAAWADPSGTTRDCEAFLDDDVARGFLHSHSYSGNALGCRAALAVLDRFAQDVLPRNRQQSAC